jgi:hypothetical protein
MIIDAAGERSEQGRFHSEARDGSNAVLDTDAHDTPWFDRFDCSFTASTCLINASKSVLVT